MRRTVIFILSLLAAAFSASARNTVRVQAPNLVSDGEQFNVTFVMEGEEAPSDFSWTPGEGFQLVWGPQKGSSTSISIVNGKKTKSSQTTYTYVLLARKTGVFKLPAATATFKGGSVTSESVTVEVVSGGSASSSAGAASSGRGGSSQDAGSTGSVPGEDLFMRLTLNKSRVVVGEPVTAVLKLYSRVSISGFEDARFPSFDGFWSQELQAPTNIEFHREKVGETICDAAVLRSWTLIPQQSGDIRIDPAELVCLVNVRAPRASTGSIFDSFFEDEYRTLRKRITTGDVTVHVSQLPAGAPSSFAGGVGSFNVSASISRDSLKTHDAASLKVTVSGRGNVSLLEAPKVSFPPDFELYDVKTTESVDKAGGRLSGSKTFEYPFIPRSHGDFVLDPVEYSYYDVQAGKYVTLRTAPIPVHVARGAQDSEAPSMQGQLVQSPARKDVRDLGSDIRFIATKNPGLAAGSSFLVGSPLFVVVLALLALAAAAFWTVSRKIAVRRKDVASSRGRAATKKARRRLSLAQSYLTKNLPSAFYDELHKALLGFASDKLNMNVFDFSKENISSGLASGGVPQGLVSDYVSLLEACESARYSMSGEGGGMDGMLEKAVAIISEIDSVMKKKNPSAGKWNATAGIIALVLFCGPLSGSASAASDYPDSLWTAGVEAYVEGDWSGALADWTAIGDAGISNAVLFYNIGNAFFKNEDYGHAILYYERALKLDPSSKDVRFNLEYARGFVQDRIETVPEFFLRTWMRKVRWSMSSNAWAVLSIVMFALALAFTLLFLLSGSEGLRRTGFFSGLAALILFALCLGFSVREKAECESRDSAVVLVPVSSVKSAPGADSAKDLFVLHEGTKVRVVDEVASWRNIELSDGRQGWIRASDIGII